MTDKRKWNKQQRAVSAAMKKRWAEPAFRRKMIKMLRAQWKDPVFLRKMRKIWRNADRV